jgi:hypothetical protein
MPELFQAIVEAIILAALPITVAVWVVRALIRWKREGSGKSAAVSLFAALATAALVFALTYLSAWAALRQQVSLEYGGVSFMRHLAIQIRTALSGFADKHGHYPDSLEELEELKDCHLVDAWGRPYQYKKTGKSFQLLSLGRDGKPGGIGLDADIDLSSDAPVTIEPTFSQFLFDATGSRTLFGVALMASLFAGVACFLASGPQQGQAAGRGQLLWSVVLMTIVAMGVSFFLLLIYLVSQH